MKNKYICGSRLITFENATDFPWCTLVSEGYENDTSSYSYLTTNVRFFQERFMFSLQKPEVHQICTHGSV